MGCDTFSSVTFLDYFNYVLRNNYTDFENHILSGLDLKRIPKRCKEEIIEGALAINPNNLEKKQMDKNYYKCHAVCLVTTFKQLFDSPLYEKLNDKNIPYIALHNYSHIMRSFLMDADNLINVYHLFIKKDNWKYKTVGKGYIHFQSIHQVFRQSLFGQVSAHSFSDMEIDASIAVLRQLVEVRIRRAFGTLSYIDKNGNLLPLSMSIIFEAARKYKEEISFSVKFDNLERIYKWSNMYVHSGLNEFPWIVYFLERYIRPFTFGEWIDTGWNVKNGIKMQKEIMEAIQCEIKKKNIDCDIFGCEPECKFFLKIIKPL